MRLMVESESRYLSKQLSKEVDGYHGREVAVLYY